MTEPTETEELTITAPVPALRVLRNILGRMLDWRRMEELNESTKGQAERVVEAAHDSLSDLREGAESARWVLPHPIATRLFGPLFHYLGFGERCPHCYQIGRAFLELLTKKLISADILKIEDVVDAGLVRFDPGVEVCAPHGAQADSMTRETEQTHDGAE